MTLEEGERVRLANPVAAVLTTDTLRLESEEESRAIPVTEIEQVEVRHPKPLATFFLVMGLSVAAASLLGMPIVLAN
ncbi:MAG: hypothetical protein AAF938_13150 [Myxococcota bacterium]